MTLEWSFVGELSISLAIIISGSLSFARWAIERQDREDRPPKPPAMDADVRQRKRLTLLKKREEHEKRMLANGGNSEEAEKNKAQIDAIDRELSALYQEPS